MSLYTDVILTFESWENIHPADVNRAVFPDCDDKSIIDHRPFVVCKAPDVLANVIMVASVNYFLVDEFVERLRVLVWQTPENVQIFYKLQDYDLFEMVRLREADNGDAATRSD